MIEATNILELAQRIGASKNAKIRRIKDFCGIKKSILLTYDTGDLEKPLKDTISGKRYSWQRIKTISEIGQTEVFLSDEATQLQYLSFLESIY